MRRDINQCKTRHVPLKLVHGNSVYDIHSFEVKKVAHIFEKATMDFKKVIDPGLSVSLFYF